MTTPGVTTDERSKVASTALGPILLQVINLVIDDKAILATVLAKSLQVTGGVSLQSNLAVTGDGSFGRTLGANGFSGSGTGRGMGAP